MEKPTVSDLWIGIYALKDDIERRCSSILNVKRAIEPLSLRLPRTAPPELAFFQTITWLYAFYYEVGGVTFRFLLDRLRNLNVDKGQEYISHYHDIRRLRTYLQHNLNLESTRNLELQRACENWFSSQCGSAIPYEDREWEKSLLGMLEAVIRFLEEVNRCIRDIEKDESCHIIVAQWTARIDRYHPKHHFEKVVEEVIYDFGQTWLDASEITNRNYDKWSKTLSSRSESYIFEAEARKLVEQTFLSEFDLPLPITGIHLMRELGIPPGEGLRMAMLEAKSIYFNDPMPREELIRSLALTLGIKW